VGEEEFGHYDVELVADQLPSSFTLPLWAWKRAAFHVTAGFSRSQAMNWIALRMLTGDRSKYLGLISASPSPRC